MRSFAQGPAPPRWACTEATHWRHPRKRTTPGDPSRCSLAMCSSPAILVHRPGCEATGSFWAEESPAAGSVPPEPGRRPEWDRRTQIGRSEAVHGRGHEGPRKAARRSRTGLGPERDGPSTELSRHREGGPGVAERRRNEALLSVCCPFCCPFCGPCGIPYGPVRSISESPESCRAGPAM